MNNELLSYSIDKIASLRNYYRIVINNIKDISEEGKQKHIVGAMLDNYLSLLVYSTDEVKKETTFLSMEKEAKKFIKVDKVFQDGESKKVAFSFLSKEIAKKVGNVRDEGRLYDQYEEMPFIFGSTSLVMLITRFEEFISLFLSNIFVLFPDKYINNKSIVFSEIPSGDIEKIKRYIVDREVNAKMFGSFKEWFKIYSDHGLSKLSFENDLITLEEIYARRNVIVHNSGIVNSIYINSVKNTKEKEGNFLKVDENYLDNAFKTIYRIIILMMIESTKLNRENQNVFLEKIFIKLFNLLREEEYEICKPTFSVLSEKEELNTEIRTMAKINKWICIIALHGHDVIKNEIENYDISALHKKFAMAKHILLQNYDKANTLLEDLLKAKEITTSEIEGWPLFKWYRESEQYKILHEKFSNDFQIENTEVDKQIHKKLEKKNDNNELITNCSNN